MSYAPLGPSRLPRMKRRPDLGISPSSFSHCQFDCLPAIRLVLQHRSDFLVEGPDRREIASPPSCQLVQEVEGFRLIWMAPLFLRNSLVPQSHSYTTCEVPKTDLWVVSRVKKRVDEAEVIRKSEHTKDISILETLPVQPSSRNALIPSRVPSPSEARTRVGNASKSVDGRRIAAASTCEHPDDASSIASMPTNDLSASQQRTASLWHVAPTHQSMLLGAHDVACPTPVCKRPPRNAPGTLGVA